MILVQRSTIGSTVSAFSGGNIGTTRATPIAAGLLRHLAEFRQDVADLAAGRRNPAIAIADRTARAIGEGAADVDRRVRFLHRFWLGDHWIEMDELPVVFGLGFCPDFLHRLDVY